jgi:hypothetical protein
MIEVVLAMAIIAFGMSSILGLFPVGLNALKSSMVDNYCSDSVDQMIGYIKNQAEYSAGNYTAFVTGLPDAAALTAAVGADRSKLVGGKTLDAYSADFLTDYRTSNFPATYKRVFTDMNIFQVSAGMPYLYYIVQGQITSKNIDFSAMLLVWKSPVSYTVKDAAGNWYNGPAVPNAYQYFSGINFELSWPLEKPYAQREKKYYYIEVRTP